MLNRLRIFMMGRYGVDQLSLALIILYVILRAIMLFIPIRLVALLSLVPLVLAFWRTLSRNTGKRYEENQRFLAVWNPIRNRGKRWYARFKDRKFYRYYKCPSCRKTLRVPKGANGRKIEISCPVCKEKFIKKQ